jgi:hypothetical protein
MRGYAYFNLSNEDVQAGRSAITIPGSDRPLHDYVPLYFGFKTPMVAANQAHNESLLFLRFSLEVLRLPGVVITDGNARSMRTKFRTFRSIDDLNILDPKAIQTIKYAGDDERKRKKQAEILVPDQLSITVMQDIICFSSTTRKRVVDILHKNGINKSVIVNMGWYFVPGATRN